MSTKTLLSFDNLSKVDFFEDIDEIFLSFILDLTLPAFALRVTDMSMGQQKQLVHLLKDGPWQSKKETPSYLEYLHYSLIKQET